MFCESCGNIIPDDAAVCPKCGVHTSIILEKPALQTEKQTVPAFVNNPEAEPESKTEASFAPETDTVIENTASSGKAAKKKSNAAISVGYVLGIITIVLSIIPYSYAFFFSNIPFILFIFPVSGIVLSIIGLFIKQGKNVSKAVTGIILSVIGSVILILGYYFFFLPGYKKLMRTFDDWASTIRAQSPYGLANTAYSFEGNNELDFSYGDCEILSLHVDSYKVDL